jgi:uncharacterized protein YndB with AHSA1/START domain
MEHAVGIDPIQSVNAITREVRTVEKDGKPAKVAVARRSYDTTPEDLWDAITSGERIPRWFLPVTGDLRLGGRYQLQGNAGGTITTCDPPKHLGITWEYAGQVSWVDVFLSAKGKATELVLEHLAHVPEEFWGQFGPGAVGVGWDLGLHGLAIHIGTRRGVLPSEGMEWMGSPEGKDFIRVSSAGWGEASIADGTDRDAAMAAMGRTTAFYTGEQTPG